ncbi:T9SS type B sorting domain-containing protein, partial [Tenacibaculum sp. TC6]|uniref:T9SS type B sorting domain-containing protein n=1 Tax=Tenacibaculum sp. TC6 TaxID=3423223 RepID=UPI003D35F78E
TTDESGGTVAVTVYDSNNCTGSTTVNIAPFNKLSDPVITVSKAIDCATGENISISYTSVAPIPNVEYTVTGINGTVYNLTQSSPMANPEVFTGLATGIYEITIYNPVTGCRLTTVHQVNEEPLFDININKARDVSCIGTATGELTFDFSSSSPYTGSYDYQLMNTNGTAGTGDDFAVGGVVTGNTGGVLSTVGSLSAGEYYVVVTMTSSPFCPVTSPTVRIEEPVVGLGLTATPSLISCIGPNSGEVTLTANGGWGAYEYELINTTTGTTIQNFSTNSTIEGLNAGQYSATVRDLNGCTETVTFELIDPTPITATYTVTDNACNGDNSATITVTNATGGQGNPPVYTYTLTYPDGTVSANQSSNVFTNLEAGAYIVTVYDDYSCQSAPINITITDPTKVVAQASIIDPITCNRNQSTIEVTGTGGTGGYTYSMDGVNFVASNIFNVDAGKHEFYVRDANGCISDPFTLVTVDPYEAIASKLNVEAGFVTCNGENNGVLSATVSGGLGNYQYELLDASDAIIRPIQTSNMFSGLPVGTYKIRVYSSNANGDVCEIDTALHDIVEPEVLRLSELHTHVTCNGSTDGTITVTPQGGNEGYEYNISPGFDPSKFVTTNVFENLAPGDYTITVKDRVGCYEIIQVQIAEPTAVNISLVGVTQQVCSTDPSPTITIEATGGSVTGSTTNYIVSINGVDLPGTYPEGTIVLGAAEGIRDNMKYGISVRPVNAPCSATPLNTVITTTKAIALQLQAALNYTCPVGNVINANVQDEYKDVVVYSLYDNGVLVTSNDTGVFTNVAPSANYTVEAEHITSGCPVSVIVPEVIDIQQLALAVDDTQKNTLIANASFGLPPYEYSVDGGDFGPDNQFTILETRDYRIVVRDSRGCEVEIIVEGVYITIEVPNLFTPDGDGTNDYWYPINVEDYHDIKVFIYDRYARQITTFEGSHQGWDGKYDGKELPSGDYWYTIYFKELSGQERKIMGHFTLYR